MSDWATTNSEGVKGFPDMTRGNVTRGDSGGGKLGWILKRARQKGSVSERRPRASILPVLLTSLLSSSSSVLLLGWSSWTMAGEERRDANRENRIAGDEGKVAQFNLSRAFDWSCGGSMSLVWSCQLFTFTFTGKLQRKTALNESLEQQKAYESERRWCLVYVVHIFIFYSLSFLCNIHELWSFSVEPVQK